MEAVYVYLAAYIPKIPYYFMNEVSKSLHYFGLINGK